jgi:hypothetical protein
MRGVFEAAYHIDSTIDWMLTEQGDLEVEAKPKVTPRQACKIVMQSEICLLRSLAHYIVLPLWVSPWKKLAGFKTSGF